jgi:hypothetical protein
MLSEMTNLNSVSDYFNLKATKSFCSEKEILIDIAENGKNKPNKKTPLGRVLSDYTKKLSKNYNKEFDVLIRKIRPDWFLSQTEIVKLKKQRLLEIAKNGGDRPNSKKTMLGKALVNYTTTSSLVFDPVFTKKIHKLRPDWFGSNNSKEG